MSGRAAGPREPRAASPPLTLCLSAEAKVSEKKKVAEKIKEREKLQRKKQEEVKKRVSPPLPRGQRERPAVSPRGLWAAAGRRLGGRRWHFCFLSLFKLEASEESQELTPEEQLADKLRLQKLQEEADLELAKETFGECEGRASPLSLISDVDFC